MVSGCLRLAALGCAIFFVPLAGCGGGGGGGAAVVPPAPTPTPGPRGPDLSEVGRYAFIPEFNRGAIAVYDLRTSTLTTEIAVGGAPTAVAVSRLQPYLFVVDFGRSSIVRVDLRDVGQPPVLGPGGVNVWDAKYAPDGAHVYFTESQGVGYDVVDPNTLAKRRVSLDSQRSGEIAPSPRAIAFDAVNPSIMYLTDIVSEFMGIDTTRDVIASYWFPPGITGNQSEVRALPGGGAVLGTGLGIVTVVGGSVGKEIATVGQAAYITALVVSPDGVNAYAAPLFSTVLSVINLKTGTRTGTIPVNDPEGIDISPDGSRLVVLDGTDDAIVEVDRATSTVVRTTQLAKGAHPRAYGSFIR
jgi:DNA-binding beta-propeller fold protein YncE